MAEHVEQQAYRVSQEPATSSRDFEVAGAVFWIAVLGVANALDVAKNIITNPSLTGPPGAAAVVGAGVFAVILIAMAFFGLRRKAWAFVVAMAVGIFLVLGAVVDAGDEPLGLATAMEVFIGLPTVYASYLAFLRLRAPS